ncbi:GntR family transcriptional regulator [Enterococcus faecium]|uniref:GntR family transcriptional regulator n=1 Tax=Enterococcus faecium TaxID=1352 RepID=UPI00296248A6|nr:GntR family transcriptional regulator [Enterococcus faecium]
MFFRILKLTSTTGKYYPIYEDLKYKIQHGEYKENEKIPSENQLCNLYSSSRATVRKAIELLAIFGFVDRSQGKQTIVSSKKNWNKRFLTEEEYKKLVLFNLKSTELNEIIALSEKYSVLKKLVDFWNNNNLI